MKKNKSNQDITRLRSEVRKVLERDKKATEKVPFTGGVIKGNSPFTGAVSGNYWTATGMPWV